MRNFQLTLFLLLTINLLPAQQSPTSELPNILPPSPEVAALMKFEEVPVDMYTGQPQISIPLISQQGNAGLPAAIGLNYHSTGVQVASRSSSVGTGWSINTGAVISRTVVDIPDEALRNGVSLDTGMWHLGEYWTTPQSTLLTPGFNWKVNGSSADHYDSQSDIFQYNIFGNTGRFIITRASPSSPLQAVLLEKSDNSEIEVLYNPTSLVVSAFVFTDNGGNEYHFDIIESSDYQTVTLVDLQGPAAIGSGSTYTQFNINSAWHLSEITSSNGITLLECRYLDSTETYETPVSTQTNRITSIDGILTFQEQLLRTYHQGILKPEFIASSNLTTSRTKKLDTLLLSTNNYIKFHYSSNAHPETNGLILERIESRNANDDLLKSVRLNTSIENSRLWLNSVEDGVNPLDIQKTLLSYFNKDLPLHNEETDDFGYKTSVTAHSQNTFSNYDPDAILSGLLTKITYPTGGSKDFDWEEHQFSYSGNQLFNDWYENPDNTTRQSIIRLINDTQTAGGMPSFVDIATNFTITHAQNIEIRTNFTENAPGSLGYYKLRIHKNSQPFQTVNISSSTQSMYLSSGNYTVFMDYIGTFSNLGGNAGGPHSISGKYLLVYHQLSSDPLPYLKGGGVRIKTVDFTDQNQTQVSKEYTYQMPDTSYSSGIVDGDYRKMKLSYTILQQRFLHEFEPPYIQGGDVSPLPNDVFYEITQNSLFNILTKGSYVGYKHVKVSETNKGYSQYTYSSPMEFPAPPATLSRPYTQPVPRNLDYKRGNLLHEMHVDDDDKELQSVVYNYTYEDHELAYNFVQYTCEDPWLVYYDQYSQAIPSNKVPTRNIPYTMAGTPSNAFGGIQMMLLPSTCFPILIHKYYETGKKLTSQTTTNYTYPTPTSAVQQLVTTVNYTYNPVNYQVKETRTVDSDGQEIKSKVYYAVDTVFPVNLTAVESQAQTALLNTNRVTTPLLQESYLDGVLTSRVWNSYKDYGSSQVVLKSVSTQKSVNDPLEPRLIYHRYDEYGNPLELSNADGTHISYFYGHGGTVPIAKIEGLGYQEIANILTGGNINTLYDYDESNLASLNILRNSSTASNPFMVTTLEYEVGVGVKKVTDPRGKNTFYFYDEFNRLKHVKDHEGNILSENEYKYATQN
ncbi:MAG: hypothetical protein WBG46_07975 [Nonlabens sp.]